MRLYGVPQKSRNPKFNAMFVLRTRLYWNINNISWKCPPPCCRRNSTCFNIFVETVRRVAVMINKSEKWLTCLVQQHQESAPVLPVQLLHTKFNNKHTLHCWKRHGACYTNNWRKSKECEETASNHRHVGMTGVQCCHWLRWIEISLSH
jgi:hypothetical protein